MGVGAGAARDRRLTGRRAPAAWTIRTRSAKFVGSSGPRAGGPRGRPVAAATDREGDHAIAIGEPDRLEVDPGDGSPALSCPWQTAAAEECAYTYPRASAGRPAGGPEGLPAFTARMRLVYAVRFEVNGAPLAIDGLPATLESPWREVAVPVAEVQAVVTGR